MHWVGVFFVVLCLGVFLQVICLAASPEQVHRTVSLFSARPFTGISWHCADCVYQIGTSIICLRSGKVKAHFSQPAVHVGK